MARLYKCDMCGQVFGTQGYYLDFMNLEANYTGLENAIMYIDEKRNFDICLDCKDEICKFIREYKKEGNQQ